MGKPRKSEPCPFLGESFHSSLGLHSKYISLQRCRDTNTGITETELLPLLSLDYHPKVTWNL